MNTGPGPPFEPVLDNSHPDSSVMTSKGKDKQEEEATPLPPAIIAQAEAAIYGNFEDGRSPRPAPRLSRVRSEYHSYPNDISAGNGAALKKYSSPTPDYSRN